MGAEKKKSNKKKKTLLGTSLGKCLALTFKSVAPHLRLV